MTSAYFVTLLEDTMADYQPRPRLDRIFPLSEACVYPGVDYADMVWYMPASEETPWRLWMLTPACAPTVAIDHHRFEPVSVGEGDTHWVDFGRVSQPLTLPERGFGQLRVWGVAPDELAASYVVTTTRTDLSLSGTLEDAERAMWGIARSQVGRTYISPSTVPVGTPTTFRLVYEASRTGLPAGALVRICVPHAFAEPQMDRPDDSGYLSIAGDGASGEAVAETLFVGLTDESHEKVDIVVRIPEGLRPGARLSITYRTDFTYLFPVTYEETDRRYWYSRMPPLSLAVALSEDHPFVAAPRAQGHTVRYVARRAERLHLFLPGRRPEGQDVALKGTFTDRFRNVATDDPALLPRLVLECANREGHVTSVGSLDVSQNLADSSRFVVPLPRLTPGVYRVKAYTEHTKTLMAVSNPLHIVPEGDAAPALYWGEIHGHSEMSDGVGSFEYMFRHARDYGALDFAAGADHACYFSDNQWQWMQDSVNHFDDPGRFCALIGYEWAGAQGHRNIYTSGERLDLYRGMYEPTHDIATVWRELHGRRDVVAGPHVHHSGRFWDGHDGDVVRFFEIYSMWGNYEHLANDFLNGGARLGFTGGGDCHDGRCHFSSRAEGLAGEVPHTFAIGIKYPCGITGALMPRLDRQSLVHALRERQTYATTGARMLVDFDVSGVAMGGAGSVECPVARAEIHACDTVERVSLVRDGVAVCDDAWGQLDGTWSYTDNEATPGSHWYYLKVTQADGEMAWTSPVWIEVQ